MTSDLSDWVRYWPGIKMHFQSRVLVESNTLFLQLRSTTLSFKTRYGPYPPARAHYKKAQPGRDLTRAPMGQAYCTSGQLGKAKWPLSLLSGTHIPGLVLWQKAGTAVEIFHREAIENIRWYYFPGLWNNRMAKSVKAQLMHYMLIFMKIWPSQAGAAMG